MASPPSPASLHPGWTAPLSTTATTATAAASTPAQAATATAATTTTASAPLHPPSPSALAAVPSSRPPTSHGDDENPLDGHDHDLSGGISLADVQQLADAAPAPFAMDDPAEDAAGQLQSATAHLPLWPALVPGSSLDLDDPAALPYALPGAPSFMSSSEHPLEPPPTLQEAHLSIQDKASFAPITSFFHYITPEKPTVPGLDLVQVPGSITRGHLHGDRYDYQGIDWSARNTTRSHVRSKRVDYEREKLLRNRGNVPMCHDKPLNNGNFFQFSRNNTAHRAFFPHFQLRNVLAATSRNDVFYAAGHRVFRTDATGTPAHVVTDLSKRLAPDGSITTIATKDNVLIAGAFEGEYAITNLASTYGSPCTFGRTTDFAPDTKSKIVNHMHLYESHATYTPQAVLCSNDYRLRVLDCATDTFTHSFVYPAAVNCSATSPNGRMRVVVGDFQETLITNAETGQPFETLNSHTDDAFACAWADDGIHIATAAQDHTVVVWDARYWARPLTSFNSELSVPRSLRFSPVGSGPRLLMVAEADDYLTVVNAQTFQSKQVFDFFGPIGGATFTPDGQSIFIANGERRFGGIIELNRTGWAEQTSRREYWGVPRNPAMPTDWAYDHHLDDYEQVATGHVERQRRPVELCHLII